MPESHAPTEDGSPSTGGTGAPDAVQSSSRGGRLADIRFGGLDHETTRDDWLTPPKLLREIYAEFGLDFDPCPWPRPEGYDGLKAEWHGSVYCNPPYGRETSKWLQKAIDEIRAGRVSRAVFLIHARTDTRAFHDLILGGASAVYFVKGRVSFIKAGTSKSEPAPFPSMIVVFEAEPTNNARYMGAWPPSSSQKGPP